MLCLRTAVGADGLPFKAKRVSAAAARHQVRKADGGTGRTRAAPLLRRAEGRAGRLRLETAPLVLDGGSLGRVAAGCWRSRSREDAAGVGVRQVGRGHGRPGQRSRHGHDRRATCYNKRLAASNGHESTSVVSAAMESAGAAAITCREAMAALKSAGFGQGELDAAIAHGALVHGDDGLVSFGIPSFHDHMAAVRERHRRKPLADRAG